ncbi:sensor histidine kinase [Sciscionella marina]|uniref:sensor histidine kinase n=1 Tax=Sciscionella marina TaxID=508770 RepID=UPI0003712D34|nr:HAMP domain-containing sensor histidine kinase [Sciscionella marina]
MCSSRRAERPRWLDPRHWSLRGRLLVGQVVILAVVCAVIGVVADVFLREFLVQELDSQMTPAVERIQHGPPKGIVLPKHHRESLDFLRQPGIPPGTLGAKIVHGKVVEAAMLGPSIGQQHPVPGQDTGIFTEIPMDDHAHSMAVGELGNYRLRSVHAVDGSTIVIGLPLSTVDDTVFNLAVLFAVVAGFGLIVAGLAGRFVIRRTLRPLDRVAETAREVSATRLDEGEVELVARVPQDQARLGTEVGQVGSALNRMLEHVSAALSARHESETRMRQFLADASHELRTPLASIRGYAELTRRSQNVTPDDIGYAMQRVESEANRMTTLVEDLLLLARLDSGRPLQREHVDLTRLVADAVNDAYIASPEHHWRLSLPDTPVTVTGDEQRLHQVVANLLANARTHTPEGTTVTITLSTVDTAAVLTVHDDGPGIPAELRPTVFERFARGDSSRSRSAGSTGLGLAIVSAVANAHGGTVEVRSQPHKTEFTVQLPVRDCAPLSEDSAHRQG